MNDINEVLEVIARILIRCFILGIITIMFWFAALKLAGGVAYSVHAMLMPITRQQFDVIHYSGMLMTKAVVFVFFFFPYVGIRLVMGQRGKSS